MAESSFTYTITPEQGTTLRNLLEENGFEFSELNYGHFAAKKGKCGVQYYKSGKLLLQGKEAREFIEFTLEPLVLGEARLGYEEELNPEMYEPHFGVDESGKGDFFGPLVIAGAYVNRDIARTLIKLGVKDSKKISSDQKACDLSDEIKKVKGLKWDVIAIHPERYNELHKKMRNLNTLLAWAHGKIIENLHVKVPDCPRTLSDQFAHPSLIERELKRKQISIILQQRTKAESDIAVAAASILARAEFINRLKSLGDQYHVKLLKGASSQVKALGAEILQKQGVENLKKVCKSHFKTFSEIVDGVQLL